MFDPREVNQNPVTQATPQPAVSLKQQQRTREIEAANTKALLEEERVYRQGTVSVRDLIAPEALEVTSSFIRLGELYARTIFVVEYPRYINVGWFAPIINMDISADISLYFYPIPAHIILKQLKKKVGNVEAGLVADAEKGAPRDPLRETALRDMEKLRDDLTQGVEHFFPNWSLYHYLFKEA
jgi:conjugal transfer ATP-binding protein TraC